MHAAVSLPQMVASSTMDAESVGLVRDYANELMAYVSVPLHKTYRRLTARADTW